MINNYVTIIDLLNQKSASGDTDPKIPQAVESIEKIFAESGAADCDALIEIFTVKFDETPDDIELLKKITTLLDETNCEESELYAKSAEALYNLEPSADAAAKLANVFAVKSEYAKAKEYYNNAISQETDAEKKSKYYYYLANVEYQQKDYPLARKHCLAAIDLNSSYGEAYILIGSAYAASSGSCGESDFEKQAVYWAAVDKFVKAKNVDPSVKETADEQIQAYSKRFPHNEITFFNGYTDGQSYKVGCWIQETTTVRTTKN
jgi:tetratricopeptide (TPR) repeat protein